jgi:bifunctional oligoribonuclease and PAP phosphatase NrnA
VIPTIVRLIEDHRSFLVTTHVDPDGDGLGSQSALVLALRKMGKQVEAVNHSPLPHRYRYLAFSPHCRTSDVVPPHDICITLDVGDLSRIRPNARREDFGRLVNIDHHVTNTLFGDVNWVDPQACAAGEMVWKLLKALPVELDRDILDSVYTAILADTGRFQYSNTNANVLRMAAEIAEAGADIHRVSRLIFASESFPALKVLRTGLGNLQTFMDGRIGVTTLSLKELKESGANEEDAESLVNFARKVDSVVVSIYLRERSDGKWKLSLRSKNGVDVAKIALAFGGGGHPYAAGAVVDPPLELALEKALAACRNVLSSHGA